MCCGSGLYVSDSSQAPHAAAHAAPAPVPLPQGSKTPRFTRGFVVFLALAVCKLGVEGVSASMDAVQPKVMLMILQQVRTMRGGSSSRTVAAVRPGCAQTGLALLCSLQC